MRRGTTPTITVTVDKDISDMVIHLAFKTDNKLLVKKNDDLEISSTDDKTILVCKLTQEETLSMRAGKTCEVQLRAVLHNGDTAIATTIGTIPVARILEDGVING